MPDLYTALQIYAAGILVWAFIMALLGEIVDRSFVLSIMVWPIMAISMAGQIIRMLFGHRPFK